MKKEFYTCAYQCESVLHLNIVESAALKTSQGGGFFNTPGEEVVGLISAVAAHSLLVGSVSV